MMRSSVILALIVVAPVCFASASVEQYLRELEAAEQRWVSKHPASYEYTLDHGVGPFGYDQIKVRVQGVNCGAKKRFIFGKPKTPWAIIKCDGYRMEDLYAHLHEALVAEPSSFEADYDLVLGYIKQASIDPRADIEDNDSGYYLESFKVTR